MIKKKSGKSKMCCLGVTLCCIFVSPLLVCGFLQELKECSGHVFVDSVPEFCLPEVSFFKAFLKNLTPFNRMGETC